MRNYLKMTVSVLSLVLILGALAFGQETRGHITGTVKDQNGAIVPNATIKLEGTNLGFSRTYTTDSEGVYDIRELPVGSYRMTISGMNLTATENVIITIGNTLQKDITLTAAGASATVDVTPTDSSTTIDTTEAKVQTNITSAQIEMLPKGTTFSSLLRNAPSVRPSEPLTGGFSINGATGAENSFIVDGQETQNFRTGALNTANDIPYQSVQEVQVKSSGFEAQFGGATGGVVNVVTKSGSNDWHGEFGTAFNSQKLNAGPRPVLRSSATNSTATVGGIGTVTANAGQYVEYLPQNRDSGTNFFPTASLGGRIIKDKLWFYGIYSPQIFETTRVTNYVTGNPGNGLGRLPIGPAQFPGLPSYIQNQAPTQEATAKQTNEYAFIRLDASPTNNFRWTGSYTWNPVVQEGLLLGGTTVVGTPGFAIFGGSAGTLAGADLAARQGGRQNANNFRTEGIWTPTNKLIIGGRYTRGFLNEKLNSYFIPLAPRIRCISVATAALALQAGCSQGFSTNSNNSAIAKDVSVRTTVDADVSYLANFWGRHEFKGGYTWSKITNDVESGYRDQGVISLCYSTTATINTTCNGLRTPINVAMPTLAPGVTVLGVGNITRFATRGLASNTAQTFYIQDKWQVTNRLTLSLGLRTEKEDLPAFNLGQAGSSGVPISFGFGDKLAPRLGVSYALTSDGKTKIAAFYGRFFDRLKFELPRGSFGGDFFRRDYFLITSDRPAYTNYVIPNIIGSFKDPLGGQCPIAPSGSFYTLCQADFRTQSNVVGQGGGVDPDLKPYRQDEATVEFQRELFKNSIFGARYLWRNLANAIEDAGYISAAGSEVYFIANPCKGLHAQKIKEFGYDQCVGAQRNYKALEFDFNSRYWDKWTLGVNYTYSRLYGNYSGLASSDEAGRLSPGVTRYFDLPWVGFTALGKPDNGLLATDRPHVFKYTAGYNFDWRGSRSNSTDITVFGFAESGTPLTSFVDLFGIAVPATVRGDMGRTETYTQTDLSITHRYKFGRDNKFGLAIDLNILNLFNESNVLNVDTNYANPAWYELATTDIPGNTADTYPYAVNYLFKNGVKSIVDAQIAPTVAGCGTYSGSALATNFCTNASRGYANQFQGPRNVRFGFRFIF